MKAVVEPILERTPTVHKHTGGISRRVSASIWDLLSIRVPCRYQRAPVREVAHPNEKLCLINPSRQTCIQRRTISVYAISYGNHTGWMMTPKYGPLQLLLVLLSSMLLAACTTAGGPTDAEEAAERGEMEYIIGAGDALQIYVRDNPDLSVELPVRPDGKISVPMVRDVRAAGMTPSQLADDLEESLSEFIRSPNVTVMVTSFVGAYDDQVKIIGQAMEPQAVPYRDGMTVLDALIQVGGLTQFAAGNRARLVRGGRADSETVRVRLNDLLNDGDMRQNLPLRPGDVIVIPEAFF